MKHRSSSRNAVLVGSGIFLSRIIGLVRERIFAHYFGNSDAADAFKAALKIPNLLQNLFGEGALSSSFIPVYANLLASGDKEEANRVARVIGSMLILAMSLLVLAGVLATPLLIDLIAPGFKGVKRDSTIQMVRIMFPGVGVLVLSAWCLGILNSHRRFFLPYAAPILWNRRHDCRAGWIRRQDARRMIWPRPWRGDRWPEAFCSSECSFLPSSGSQDAFVFRSTQSPSISRRLFEISYPELPAAESIS